MEPAPIFAGLIVVLIIAKWLTQVGLDWANRRHVRRHADDVPDPFKPFIDPDTYRKSVQYTLAKSRLGQFELAFDALILLAVLFSGVLPWIFDAFAQTFGLSAWSMSAFLLAVMIGLSLLSLPFDWYEQFRLEESFGFNTMTTRLWWMDRLKGLLIALLLAYPLLALILKLVEWTGPWWWLWAWGAVLLFQFVMLVLAPVLLLPLFNKFTPLEDGELKERLMKLADRTGFHAKSIQVMDGSKRSRHSNAFFTGFGRFRKIVLFDTLLQQLTEPEIEAVLAHEIGHYKLKHIPKLLLVSVLGLFITFLLLAFLANQSWFYQAFGFEPAHIAPAFLLFALLGGLFSFWFSPVSNWLSRRYEFQADSYAASTVREHQPLVQALRKLNEKNLSNLTPHKLYSRFYYSHPTLVEREQALVPAGANDK